MPYRIDRPTEEAEPRPEPSPDEWDEVPPPADPTDEPEYDEA